ncbi:MAG TPA: hypothetical protein VME69_04210 [Methylocella sp.]|nr:hypothetical protein [Methylocella sp.]
MNMRRMPVKSGESVNEMAKIPWMNAMGEEKLFKRICLVEAAHDHKPVDWDSGPSDRKAAICPHQGLNAEIDLTRQAAVQDQLGTASAFPTCQSREIKIGEANRFLQLDDPITSQKNPRHMGFSSRNLNGVLAISRGLGEKGDFIGENRRAVSPVRFFIDRRVQVTHPFHASALDRREFGSDLPKELCLAPRRPHNLEQSYEGQAANHK